MAKGIWLVWNFKPANADVGDYDEVYLSLSWMRPRPALDVISSYVQKLRRNKYKVFLSINGYADEDNVRTLEDIKKDIDDYTPICDGLSFDYIRYPHGHIKNIFNTKPIYEILDYAKTKNKPIKMAVFPLYNSWLYGQSYWAMQKYGVIQPMLYPQDMFRETNEKSNKLTRQLIKLTKFLFPSSEPCLQAWNEPEKKNFRTLKDLEEDIKVCNNGYSVFRYETLKRLK